MTDSQKKLILDFALKRISKETFNTQFEYGSDPAKYILYHLTEAGKNKDADLLEFTLLLYFNLHAFKFDESHIQLLGELLLGNWHHNHENIAGILQELSNRKCLPYLEKAIYLNLEYLAFDDNQSFIRKCFFAIGDINNTEAWDKIKILSTAENPIIKACAIEQSGRNINPH